MKKFCSLFLFLLLFVFLLSACAAPASTTQPTEALVIEPTPAPTATPTPTPTLTPAPTLEPAQDPDWASEPIGSLKLDMPKAEVIAVLGEPEKAEEPQVWGIDGRTYQFCSYAKQGVELYFAWEPDQPETATLYRYTVKLPFDGKTPRGIGVGSTKDEVMSAYREGYHAEENTIDSQMIIGSVYGGILFDLDGDTVTSISFGAFAE